MEAELAWHAEFDQVLGADDAAVKTAAHSAQVHPIPTGLQGPGLSRFSFNPRTLPAATIRGGAQCIITA